MDHNLAIIKKLEKFDYGYYPVWETLIRTYLKSKKLWEYCLMNSRMIDFSLYECKIEEAKFIIYSKLCDLLIKEFRDCKGAYDLLIEIKKVSTKPPIFSRLGPIKYNGIKKRVIYNKRKYKWYRKFPQTPLKQNQPKRQQPEHFQEVDNIQVNYESFIEASRLVKKEILDN